MWWLLLFLLGQLIEHSSPLPAAIKTKPSGRLYSPRLLALLLPFYTLSPPYPPSTALGQLPCRHPHPNIQHDSPIRVVIRAPIHLRSSITYAMHPELPRSSSFCFERRQGRLGERI
ncbi:hypothetical protein C8J57DRAFT_1370195, partial [Mycena rebaudengoi]